MAIRTQPRCHTALVLSGGGVRGAYEAGVLAGLLEALGRRSPSRSPFDILSGTSVGAINAAHLAAHADRADDGVAALLRLWRSLKLETHLRPRLRSFLGRSRSRVRSATMGRALLDPRPFEELVERSIPWDRLHANVRAGLVRAFIVSALDVADGRTNTFVELAPGADCVRLPAQDPRRITRIETVTSDHVLASAALPLLFPARRVGGSYFCDGGLRFNTPIGPAIRAGARKLVVVALRSTRPSVAPKESLEQYPNPIFLVGKILNALLQDPIDYDLQVLARTNRMLEAMDAAASESAREHVARVFEAERGLRYRRLRVLVFRPSENVGALALEHLRRHGTGRAGYATALLLEKAASLGAHVEADFLSYVLFDGAFANTLIEVGRNDVRARRDEVEAFFGGA